MRKIIVLAGPTGVGKSDIALRLARRIGGELLSADSVAQYRYLDIGSAKPERTEIPLHLVDLFDPNDESTASAGSFVRAARRSIDDVCGRGKVPIVVGGTSMYMKWLVHGMPSKVPPKGDPLVRAKVNATLKPARERRDWDAGLAILRTVNPKRASGLQRNDWYRLSRALEIDTLGAADEDDGDDGFSGLQQTMDCRCVFLVTNREALYRRIDLRCTTMLRQGLLRETATLLRDGKLRPDSTPGRSIGYRQAIDFLQGGDERAFADFLADFSAASRQYARRQLVWFRGDEEFRWVATDTAEEGKRGAEERTLDLFKMDRSLYEQTRMDEEQQRLRRPLDKAGVNKMRHYNPDFPDKDSLRASITEAFAILQ